MKTTPMFDLMCVLNAESAKVNEQYRAAIDRFARDAARRSPDKADAILSAAKKMTDATALVHAEASRVLANGGKALAGDPSLLRLFIGSMLGNLNDMPASVLGAANIRGHYIGWDSVRSLHQHAEHELVQVLVDLESRDPATPESNTKAA